METLPEGYWQVQVRAVDRAGNISNVLTRTHIIDTTAPSLDLPLFSGTLTASDNVGLRQYDMRLTFAGLPAPYTPAVGFPTPNNAIPLGAPTQIAGLGITNRAVARSFTLTTTPATWRGIQDGVGGAIYPMNGAGFGVWDLAWNFNEFIQGYPAPATQNQGAYDALVSDGTAGANPAGALATFTTSTPAQTNNGVTRQVASDAWGIAIPSSGTATSRTITATATGTLAAGTGYRRPFHTVHFYRVDVLTGQVFWIAQATAPTVSFPDGTQAQYAWSASFSMAGVRAGSQRYFAVGVDFDGDALKSATTAEVAHTGSYQTQN
jgi:hypothetical protein